MLPVPKIALLATAGVLGILYVLSAQHEKSADPKPGAPCRFEVTADLLNVRTGPGSDRVPADEYAQGAVITATPEVLNGYRKIGPNQWVSEQFLAPARGSSCE